ncbi:MAG: hypothetical protein LAT57_14230, partial [Balneolales bacterium]|nr:hypothetical protein [Balneolales bacterium]
MKRYLQTILLISAGLMLLVGQVNAQSLPPAVADEETPEFNFPRQIGNVWVYEWQSNCRGEKACAVLRKELIDEIEVDGMS